MESIKSTLILILIVTALSVSILIGCNFTKPSNNSVVTPETFYSDALETLVSDKTITQTQSNQVFLKVLQNVNDSEGCINGLNELVTNNIITQSQVTIINDKIQLDMNHVMESN